MESLKTEITRDVVKRKMGTARFKVPQKAEHEHASSISNIEQGGPYNKKQWTRYGWMIYDSEYRDQSQILYQGISPGGKNGYKGGKQEATRWASSFLMKLWR
jgi:hypothetical protein